ncbi:MAG: RNA polymerase sigma factor [Polyangiaceae bacterium]
MMTFSGVYALTDLFPERPEDESELLARKIAKGEIRAVARAYELHAAYVRGFARRLTGDDANADDLVHEVFLELPAHAKRFRGEGSFRSFLVSIAVNHARHHVREAARRRARGETYSNDLAVARSPERPDANLEKKELADMLSSALDELPLDQRVAFVLFEVEERSGKEVASIVGAREETVRARVFHAKAKLREILSRRADSSLRVPHAGRTSR